MMSKLRLLKRRMDKLERDEDAVGFAERLASKEDGWGLVTLHI